MNQLLQDVTRVIVIGIGATAVMDLWLLLLKRMNMQTLNFAYIGRWVGHLPRGKWAHDAIARATPIRGELLLGWMAHYAIGIAFAAILVAIYGAAWAKSPSLLPALAVGIGALVAPLFVMQPAMGAGIASSRTATPVKNCFRSLANHTVFGAGLYLSAILIDWVL